MRTALVVVDVQGNSVLAGRVGTYLKKHPSLVPVFTRFGSPTVSKGLPASGKNTFLKTEFSAFRAPGFAKFLKQHDIERLLVCGQHTEACVFATAIDGVAEGYAVDVLLELCESRNNLHEPAAKIIRRLWPAKKKKK